MLFDNLKIGVFALFLTLGTAIILALGAVVFFGDFTMFILG